MQIKFEHFSACRVLIFYLPNGFYPAGAEFATTKSQSESPFLADIMTIDGVERCLLTPEALAVTYSQAAKTADIQALVLAELDDYSDRPPFFTLAKQLPMKMEIAEAIADAFIRPTLFRDNGNIEFLQLQNNILTLRFTGHCAGCPYAQNTLNNVVARTLKKYLPQLEQVQTEV